MKPKLGPNSVAEEKLFKLLQRGVDYDVLHARMAWADAESIARYVRPLQHRASVKPRVLPTAQVSGRWSTTGPPIITWPDHDPRECPECEAKRQAGTWVESEWCPRAVRDIIIPAPGTWWLKGDADAIEARIAAAYTRDEQDLEAFAKGHDLHTITAAGMFKFPLPPLLRKRDIMASSECEDWRRAVGWGGESDRRRHACKSFRYAWQYSLDERGVLAVKILHTLGLSVKEILDYASDYRRSKPGFFAGRRAKMKQVSSAHQSRTFLGRLRKLFGNQKEQMKEGWAHMVSGSVADIVNIGFIAWTRALPESWLIVNGYDSLTMGFPDSVAPADVMPTVASLVERDWEIEGITVHLPWTWKVVTR